VNRPFERHRILPAALIPLAIALGCATGPNPGRGWLGEAPRLYPNAHYQRVGTELAELDVTECMSQADWAAPRPAVAQEAALDALAGGAGGAALGAIGGAISGDAGAGAAAGAAIGAAVGLGKALASSSRPHEGYRGWTEACLREKGYEIVAWR
jgi:hypothetical protein